MEQSVMLLYLEIWRPRFCILIFCCYKEDFSCISLFLLSSSSALLLLCVPLDMSVRRSAVAVVMVVTASHRNTGGRLNFSILCMCNVGSFVGIHVIFLQWNPIRLNNTTAVCVVCRLCERSLTANANELGVSTLTTQGNWWICYNNYNCFIASSWANTTFSGLGLLYFLLLPMYIIYIHFSFCFLLLFLLFSIFLF